MEWRHFLIGTAIAIAALLPGVGWPAAPSRPATTSTSKPATTSDTGLADLTQYMDRASKLKDDDIDGRLILARWARDKQMWSQAQEMADQVLYRDPGNRAAYLILQQVDDARPLPPERDAEENLKKEMQQRFGHAFLTRNTKHFLTVYDTTDVYATQCGVAMEKAYDAFQFYFNMDKLRPEFLERRLVMILLKDREDYLAYGRQTERSDLSWSAGFYSNRSNRSIFFDEASAPSNASYTKQTTDLKTHIDQLNADIAKATRDGQTGLVNTLTVDRNRDAQSLNLLNTRLNANAQIQNTSRTMHEAAHQISFNMGIQNRGVDYPFWFSEGLACGFEVEDSAGHRGPALVNFGRVGPLKDAIRDDKLIPLSQLIATNPDPSAADAQLGLQYAESWALFHYLYKYQRQAMEQYIMAFKAHTPNRQISEDERKVMFTKAFGNDMDGLSKKWVTYLRSLPAKAN